MKYDHNEDGLIEAFRARYLIDPIHSLPKPYVHDHSSKEYYIYNEKFDHNYVEAITVSFNSKYIDLETQFFEKDFGEVFIKLFIHSNDENIKPIMMSRTSAIHGIKDSSYILEYLTNIMKNKYHIKIEETLINKRYRAYE